MFFCRRAFNFDIDPGFDESAFWSQPGYEAFFRQMCAAHETLIKLIMQSILRYLKCDIHQCGEQLTETNFDFRLNYYSPLRSDDLSSGAGCMLGHEDVDLFTLLPLQDLDGL